MDNKYLRQVSVASMIVSPEGKRVFIARRNEKDAFSPGEIVFPSGRVEGTELIVHRLQEEIDNETGLKVDKRIVYVGECTFPREGYPVNQLCFGVFASDDLITPKSDELVDLKFVSVRDFYHEVPNSRYQANLHRFVKIAVNLGILTE